jgi:hypothetical protein
MPAGFRQRRCLERPGSSRLAADDSIADTFGATVFSRTFPERSTCGAAQARVLSSRLRAAWLVFFASGLARCTAGFS